MQALTLRRARNDGRLPSWAAQAASAPTGAPAADDGQIASVVEQYANLTAEQLVNDCPGGVAGALAELRRYGTDSRLDALADVTVDALVLHTHDCKQRRVELLDLVAAGIPEEVTPSMGPHTYADARSSVDRVRRGLGTVGVIDVHRPGIDHVIHQLARLSFVGACMSDPQQALVSLCGEEVAGEIKRYVRRRARRDRRWGDVIDETVFSVAFDCAALGRDRCYSLAQARDAVREEIMQSLRERFGR